MELLVVVALVAIVGAAAIGARRSADPEQLETAAGEVANALRYARSEAMRTGKLRAVWVSPAANQVGVFQSGIAGNGSSTAGPPVAHPVDRKAWVFKVHELPFARHVAVVNATLPFAFQGLIAPGDFVVFDELGLPGVWEAGVRHPLVDGSVLLAHAGHQRTVRLAPTGRVTIQ